MVTISHLNHSGVKQPGRGQQILQNHQRNPKTSENRKAAASDALEPKTLPTVKPRETNVGKQSKTTAEKPAKSKKPSRSKKSDAIEEQEAEHELLLEALMHSEKDDGNGNTNDKFGMDDYYLVLNI